jgi:hypothetical protein
MNVTEVWIGDRRCVVEFIKNNHGTATFWVAGICYQYRCRLEDGIWKPTYQIS